MVSVGKKYWNALTLQALHAVLQQKICFYFSCALRLHTTEIMHSELINLMKEMSRQATIQAIIWGYLLILAKFIVTSGGKWQNFANLRFWLRRNYVYIWGQRKWIEAVKEIGATKKKPSSSWTRRFIEDVSVIQKIPLPEGSRVQKSESFIWEEYPESLYSMMSYGFASVDSFYIVQHPSAQKSFDPCSNRNENIASTDNRPWIFLCDADFSSSRMQKIEVIGLPSRFQTRSTWKGSE